jgi:hypothetical protein
MRSRGLGYVLALLGGFIAVVGLSTGTDVLLHALGIFPPIVSGVFAPWMLGLALLYRSLYAVVGGYVTAMLAPEPPMRAVLALALMGVLGGGAGVVAGLHGPNLWYPVGIAVGAFPLTWLGGALRGKAPWAALGWKHPDLSQP